MKAWEWAILKFEYFGEGRREVAEVKEAIPVYLKQEINTHMSREESIVQVVLAEIPEIVGVYVFGSQAQHSARADSDYDIAFLTREPVRFESMSLFDLSFKVSKVLSMEIDLINLHLASLDLRFEVVSKGKRIYCGDIEICDRFDMLSISMYQRFEEERKYVVQAYKKRLSEWQMQ